jgi:cytochrome P450
MEGARLRATVGLFRDYVPTSGTAGAASIPDGTSTLTVPPGGRVLVDIILISQDPTAFPKPLEVDVTRPLDSYIHYGWGPHQCAGMDASMVAMTAMFKTVFALPNVQRAQGGGPRGRWYGPSQGVLKTLDGPYGLTLYMTADQSSIFPFPTTMKIQWDAE